jgi:hypothetical protein
MIARGEDEGARPTPPAKIWKTFGSLENSRSAKFFIQKSLYDQWRRPSNSKFLFGRFGRFQ